MYVIKKPLIVGSARVLFKAMIDLPIRLCADLVRHCRGYCSVAFLERRSVRIGDVKVEGGVLGRVRSGFIHRDVTSYLDLQERK